MRRIVDAHLDLAWNHVRRGRDVTGPAAGQPVADGETAMAGLPDLIAGGVVLCCGTLFSEPHEDARASALEQLAVYRTWHEAGLIRCDEVAAGPAARRVPNPSDLPSVPRRPDGSAGHAPRLLVLMEGADAIRDAGDVPFWFDAGVRLVGLAWQATRHAAGTGAPGGLTALGRSVVPALDAAGMIHDLSHLAERAADELLDLATGPGCATHSNCRAIVGDDPNGRHLPDRQIAAVAGRGGVVGINAYDRFLVPSHEDRRSTLADMVAHVRHACDLTGSHEHVGLGSDLDGGLGREHTPLELETAADWPRLGDALAKHFSDPQVDDILAGNWLRFFGRSLPSSP